MDRLVEWLKREMRMESVSYVENHTHGHLLKGELQGKQVEILVTSSRHVWVKKPTERSWTTTGVYVPERVLF